VPGPTHLTIPATQTPDHFGKSCLRADGRARCAKFGHRLEGARAQRERWWRRISHPQLSTSHATLTPSRASSTGDRVSSRGVGGQVRSSGLSPLDFGWYLLTRSRGIVAVSS